MYRANARVQISRNLQKRTAARRVVSAKNKFIVNKNKEENDCCDLAFTSHILWDGSSQGSCFPFILISFPSS
uniref:Ovule protein n=1 Tax=Haemonchus contortus TaxID=6289 RepID=A0A7I4YPS5_HAECO